MRKKRMMVGVLALLMGFGWAGSNVYASEGGHHEAAEVVMPETLKEIWHEVMEGQEHLEEIITAGQLDDVHKQAFHIRDLVQALPEVSVELSPDKQQRLQESVKRVAEIADLLDKYGDAGDATNTQLQAKRLMKLLQYVETFYPEDALHSEHAEGHDEEEAHDDDYDEEESGHGEAGHHD